MPGANEELASFAANVRRWAQAEPDAPAVTVSARDEPDVSLTYGALDRRSSQVARALGELGAGPEARVAHLGRNRPIYPPLLYGASKVRAALLGLNWRLTAGELTPLLADAAPVVAVVDDEFRATAEAAIAGAGVGTRIVTPDELDRAADSADDHDPGGRPTGRDIALIFYTSGTTGVPKGAMIPVAAIDANLRRPAPWRMRPRATVLVCSPTFHTAGTGWIYLPGYHGAHCLVLRDPIPGEIIGAVARHRVAQALLVPTVIQMLLDDDALAAADLSSLETMVYGASPIAPALLVRAIEALGCEFVQAYGMTETGGPITYLRPADHDPADPLGRLRSAGTPPPGIEVEVRDPASGRPCPAGEFGEVWTRSDQQMVGYLNRADATAAALTADGWLRTGDGGHLDADGYLYLTDRLSDVIITGAENVYPLEVERVLTDHPAVAEAAVVGVADARWGETPVAVVVLRPGRAAGADELIAWCRERLAHYKAPTAVEFAAALPKNPAGKVLRRELRDARRPPEEDRTR